MHEQEAKRRFSISKKSTQKKQTAFKRPVFATTAL
jgi:hypothetical protein